MAIPSKTLCIAFYGDPVVGWYELTSSTLRRPCRAVQGVLGAYTEAMMTTIAFDGKMLAADKQCTIGTQKIGMCKIVQVGKHTWAAMYGTVDHGLMITEVLKGEREELPAIDDFDGNVVMFNTKTGKCSVIDKTLVPVYFDPPFALGSGGMAAHAGMIMGLDAASAVMLAAKVDCGTTDKVDVVTKKGLVQNYQNAE